MQVLIFWIHLCTIAVTRLSWSHSLHYQRKLSYCFFSKTELRFLTIQEEGFVTFIASFIDYDLSLWVDRQASLRTPELDFFGLLSLWFPERSLWKWSLEQRCSPISWNSILLFFTVDRWPLGAKADLIVFNPIVIRISLWLLERLLFFRHYRLSRQHMLYPLPDWAETSCLSRAASMLTFNVILKVHLAKIVGLFIFI